MKTEYYLKKALAQAHIAATLNEVPVGAVLVKDDRIVAEGYNQPISTNDPTAHAEIVVLRDAALKLKNYRLVDTTLYVTLEPCAMCIAALVHARVKRIVFGAEDPRTGAVKSAISLIKAPHFNHHIEWEGGVLIQECSELLKNFFKARRIKD